MNRTNQSTVIKEKINELLSPPHNITDKQELYTKVVQETGFPRPTVRRVAAELRKDLLKKIKILQSEAQQTITPSV